MSKNNLKEKLNKINEVTSKHNKSLLIGIICKAHIDNNYFTKQELIALLENTIGRLNIQERESEEEIEDFISTADTVLYLVERHENKKNKK